MRMKDPGSGTNATGTTVRELIAKSVVSQAHEVSRTIADAIPGSLARPKKIAEPSPFQLLLPLVETLSIRLPWLLKARSCAEKGPRKSAWICMPRPLTDWPRKLKLIGPCPGEFVHSKAAPGLKFPFQPLPWSIRIPSPPAPNPTRTVMAPESETAVEPFAILLYSAPKLVAQLNRSVPFRQPGPLLQEMLSAFATPAAAMVRTVTSDAI